MRIIQEVVEEPDDFFISAWLDTLPIDEDNPLNELVIPLVLSEETLEIAERLIVHWLVELFVIGKKHALFCKEIAFCLFFHVGGGKVAYGLHF